MVVDDLAKTGAESLRTLRYQALKIVEESAICTGDLANVAE